MRRKLLQLRLAGQPGKIFFGGQQHQIIDLRLGEEVESFGRAEAMMVGKARPVRYLDAGGW